MRKILVFLLLMIAPFIVLAHPQGDVDGNDKIGSSDYVLVRKHILKQSLLTGDKLTRADMNGDGKITSLDYIAIRKIIINGVSSTPTPTIEPTITPSPTPEVIPVTGISLQSNPNIVLKVGQKEVIKTSISPSNATNKNIDYVNSDSSIVSISQNGEITALKEGKGTITIKAGGHQVIVSYVVNPNTGYVSGDGGVWQYTSSLDQTPVRADINFFKKLATSGKGTLSGDIYTYTDSKHTYKYDIAKSMLTVDKTNALMRMYYPENKDLSTLNTFTFFGGTGPSAKDFGAYLGHLDKNREELSSSGIIILVSTRNGGNYYAEEAIISTEFVKSIVDQKSGVKNAMGGYSGSGQEAGKAANNGSYDRLIICNSNFHANNTTNLTNKEILVFSPVNDFMAQHTTTTLNYMKQYNYSNVIVVSNSNSIVNNNVYRQKFLIINPGSGMGNGHGYANISKARIFSYACR